MRDSQVDRQLSVVLAKFREHVLCGDKLAVVIGNALEPGDLADRVQRRPADFPDTLRYRIGRSEYLVALLVESR